MCSSLISADPRALPPGLSVLPVIGLTTTSASTSCSSVRVPGFGVRADAYIERSAHSLEMNIERRHVAALRDQQPVPHGRRFRSLPDRGSAGHRECHRNSPDSAVRRRNDRCRRHPDEQRVALADPVGDQPREERPNAVSHGRARPIRPLTGAERPPARGSRALGYRAHRRGDVDDLHPHLRIVAAYPSNSAAVGSKM